MAFERRMKLATEAYDSMPKAQKNREEGRQAEMWQEGRGDSEGKGLF